MLGAGRAGAGYCAAVAAVAGVAQSREAHGGDDAEGDKGGGAALRAAVERRVSLRRRTAAEGAAEGAEGPGLGDDEDEREPGRPSSDIVWWEGAEERGGEGASVACGASAREKGREGEGEGERSASTES